MHVTTLLTVLLTAAVPGANLSYDQAKAFADRDEGSLSQSQSQQLVASQGKAGGEAHATCVSPSSKSDLSPYAVVMELDSSGKVIRTWLQGKSALAVCFNGQMAKKSLFVPPHAPFYTSYEMSWEP